MRLAWALLFLIGCEGTGPISSLLCDLPCYTGPENTRNVGECRDGKPVCDSEGSFLRCEGEQLPGVELCNGLDDACRGAPDTYPLQDSELGTVCGTDVGECYVGTTICTAGAVVCDGGRGPRPEQCTPIGKDADCDGIPNNIAPELCYSGDPRELAYESSICRAGVTLCRDGAPTCVGQVLPAQTDACGDGLDQDCNGWIDDVPTSSTARCVDVVVGLDRSGSMQDDEPYTVAGLSTLPVGNARYGVWLYDIPGKTTDDSPAPNVYCHPPIGGSGTPGTWDGQPCTPEGWRQAMANISQYWGSSERYWAFVYWVVSGYTAIRWRDGCSRFVIVLGDESASTQYDSVDEADVVMALQSAPHDYTILVFTSGFQLDWDTIAAASRDGKVLPLNGQDIGHLLDYVVPACDR